MSTILHASGSNMNAFPCILQHISYQYAGLGSRLALVARREEKLDAVAEECR